MTMFLEGRLLTAAFRMRTLVPWFAISMTLSSDLTQSIFFSSVPRQTTVHFSLYSTGYGPAAGNSSYISKDSSNSSLVSS